MGNPAQQQVYYDAEQGQYYTMKPPEPSKYGRLTEEAKNSPEYANYLQRVMDTRNYLGGLTQNTKTIDRFNPQFIPTQYPEMNMLFPALNTGLLQNIASSVQPDGAMYGAGRFLAPTTTNTQGK